MQKNSKKTWSIHKKAVPLQADYYQKSNVLATTIILVRE
jgi:hypothetical protein